MKQKLFMLLMLLVTSVTGSWADNVARVTHSDETTTDYETLIAAFNAATNGETITMLDNATMGQMMTSGMTVCIYLSNKSVTLDLAGKNVTLSNSDAGVWCAGSYTLTIKNSTSTIGHFLFGTHSYQVITNGYVNASCLIVEGGSFNYNISSRIDGTKYTYEKDANGYYVVSALTDNNVVAKVDDTNYGTLSSASSVATSGKTVVLQKNWSENFSMYGGSTFNTNGNTYSGTITAKENSYIVEGPTDGVYTCRLRQEGDAGNVARIKTNDSYTYYSTLASAISAAATTEEVEVVDNFTESPSNWSIGKKVTINLNNHTLTTTSTYGFYLYNGSADLTIKNGTINNGGGSIAYIMGGEISTENANLNTTKDNALYVRNASYDVTINIDANSKIITTNTTSKYGDAIAVYSNGSTQKVTLNISGTVECHSIYQNNYVFSAIVTNGTQQTNDATINIYQGARLISEYGNAIYAPAKGSLNIYGGYIEGKIAGIALKSGNFTMTGGELVATGKDSSPTEGYSDGVNASGAALQIESNKSYYGNINVSITGGTLTSQNGITVYEYLASGTTATSVKSINVNYGLFKSGKKDDGTDKAVFLFSEQLGTSSVGKNFVSGGYYSVSADDRSAFQSTYVDANYAAIANTGEYISSETYPTFIGKPQQTQKTSDYTIDKKENTTYASDSKEKVAVETNTLVNSNVTNFVTDIRGGVKEGVIPTTSSKNYIRVKLQAAMTSTTQFGGTDETTIVRREEFDVKPVYVSVDEEGVEGTPVEIPNSDIKSGITFRLPVNKDVTAVLAHAYHITEGNDTEDLGLQPIQGDYATGKYVELTSISFSNFILELAEGVTAYYATTAGTASKVMGTDAWATFRNSYINAVGITSPDNKDWAANQTNIVYNNGTQASPAYVCPNFVLTDLCESEYDAMSDDELKDVINFYSPVTFTATAGSYHRSLRSGYNSACVPFALSSISGATLLKYSYFDGTTDKVYFSEASSIAAGEATIIQASAATDWNETFSDTEIVGTPVESTSDPFFGGVFITTAAYASTAGATGYYSVRPQDGMFAALANYLFPLRACFHLTMPESGQTAREFSIAIIDSSATGVDSIGTESISDNSIYTIDGKRVESANARGMYIINGKKVIK